MKAKNVPWALIGALDVSWKQTTEREARVESTEVDFMLDEKRFVPYVDTAER